MQCKVMNHICNSFWCSLKNSKKLSKKAEFVANSNRSSFLLRPISYALNFMSKERYHKVTQTYQVSYHLYYFTVLQKLSFLRNNNFGHILGGFSQITLLNKCGQILLKFGPVMKRKACYGILLSLENFKKLSQKTDFLARFWRFSNYAFSYTL